ncbi:hypothetical protein D3C85_1480890 [compost metagenome]
MKFVKRLVPYAFIHPVADLRLGAVGYICRALLNHRHHGRAVCRFQQPYILLWIKPQLHQQILGQQIRRSAVPPGIYLFILEKRLQVFIRSACRSRSFGSHQIHICAVDNIAH